MTTSKRLPRMRRAEKAARPPLKLTQRDAEIIKAVWEHYSLTAAQIGTLFSLTKSPLHRRLQRLFHHGFLDRQYPTLFGAQFVNVAPLYTVGRHGMALLTETFGVDPDQVQLVKRAFSWRFAEHIKAINDVRVAVTVAAANNNWTLTTWQDERVFRRAPEHVLIKTSRGHRQEKPVLPDGYFCLVVPQGRAHFFLEVDLGHEAEQSFRPQILVYEEYCGSGAYERHYKTQSLRILVVTTTPQRLETLKRITQRADGDHKYWFTTLEQITPTTILTAPIWEQLDSSKQQPLIDPFDSS